MSHVSSINFSIFFEYIIIYTISSIFINEKFDFQAICLVASNFECDFLMSQNYKIHPTVLLSKNCKSIII